MNTEERNYQKEAGRAHIARARVERETHCTLWKAEHLEGQMGCPLPGFDSSVRGMISASVSWLTERWHGQVDGHCLQRSQEMNYSAPPRHPARDTDQPNVS
jgi:hypothetical protein